MHVPRAHSALFLLLGSLLLPVQAHAFRFIPFTADFTPSGPGANQTFRVENNSSEPIAVEISVHRRAMNLDGSDALTPAEDDFVVFPAQVVLQAQESQIVRVQWAGDAAPKHELAYRIIAEQLPVELGPPAGTGGAVKILVRYVGSIYVLPAGARSDVALESARPHVGADGQKQLAVTLHNRGTSHAILSGLKLRVRAQGAPEGATRVLDEAALAGFAGENVLALQRRQFLLAWPAGVPEGPVQVDFEFDRESR